MTSAGHIDLLGALHGISGKVMLSGYASALYDDALGGWHRIERKTYADGARSRVEVLWCNFRHEGRLL